MGKTAARIISNTAFVFLQRLGGRGLMLILTVYMARKLGGTDFGTITFALGFTALFSAVADPGLSTLAVRNAAAAVADRENQREGFARLLSLKLALSALYLAAVIGLAQFMTLHDDARMLIYLMAGYGVTSGMGTFFSSVYQANERMHYLFLTMTAMQTAMLLLAIPFIAAGFGVRGVGTAYLAAGTFYCALNAWLVYTRFFKPAVRFDPRFWSASLSQALPLATIALISLAYYNINTVLLTHFKTETAAGYYGAGYKLFFTIASLSGALMTALFPVLSRLYAESGEKLMEVYRKVFKVLWAAGLPLAAGGVILAEPIILLLFGEGYRPAVPVLGILSSVIMFSFLNGLSGYLMTAMNRQATTARILFVSAGVNVLLALALIPRAGATGAAAATAVAEVLFFFLFLAVSPVPLRTLPYREIIKALLATGAMALVVSALRNVPVIPLICLGMLTYAVSLLLLRYFDDEDIGTLKGSLWPASRR